MVSSTHKRSLATLGVVAGLLAAAVPATASPAPSGPSIQGSAPAAGSVAQGIIMRDGGVCDPIRHMGC